jgi:predicted amidohydrolase YtcJ
MVSRRDVIAGAAATAVAGAALEPAAAATPAADLVIYGGPIVTMNEAHPTAGAIAVKHGTIVAVGHAADIRARWIGPKTRTIDLAGKTLMTGFIDAHGHFMNAPRVVVWANVSPVPVGPVKTIPDIITALKANVAEQKIAAGEWIIGYGYDGTALAEGRELTRADLDPHFPDNPVMAIHVSNHGAVLNTAALKTFDITDKTPTPEGGLIAREPGTQQPAGLLMEPHSCPSSRRCRSPRRRSCWRCSSPRSGCTRARA